MKKIRIRIRLKIYPVLWSIMVIAAVYLLLRFATITFTEEMGQAGLMDALSAKLCINLMESGSPLLKYSADEDGKLYAFPVSLFGDTLALGDFIEDDRAVMVNAQDSALRFNGYNRDSTSPFKSRDDSQGNDSQVSNSQGSNSLGNDSQGEDNQKNGLQAQGKGLSVFAINSDQVGQEYLLTNGAVMKSSETGDLIGDGEYMDEQLKVNYEKSDLHDEDAEDSSAQAEDDAVETVATDSRASYTLEKMKDVQYLVRNFYIVDGSTTISEAVFNGEKLLSKDMTIKQDNKKPQILIYHTHSQEEFIDSRPGKAEDTVVGVGSYLAKILEEDYGYNVIHDKSTYDIVNGSLDRNVAYNQSADGVEKVLKENPSIEVLIDLHRNSGKAKTVTIDGKKAAQVMLFNGLSRDQNGPITYLDNPNLQDNLAFSLQLQLESVSEYPGFFLKNYLKSYRYNLHFRPKSLLVELGTVNNTVEEAMNAMPPFAKVLDAVLSGEAQEQQ
ncbi:MAG TPA: hypothetical protein GXX75_18580 [Clostridiales bacterium]|nr:hypothetical protein [Clostridiales bacterium]